MYVYICTPACPEGFVACTKDGFSKNYLGCVAPESICDKVADCRMAADEWNCDNGKLIHRYIS